MHVEAGVGETDDPFVELFLVGTPLVPTHEKDRLPIRIEGEGDAPYLALPAKPMYFNDHNPPHFHVRYEEYRALVGIEPLELRDGRLPPRVLGLVIEWGEMHQAELMQNWTTLAKEGNFRRIAPLV